MTYKKKKDDDKQLTIDDLCSHIDRISILKEDQEFLLNTKEKLTKVLEENKDDIVIKDYATSRLNHIEEKLKEINDVREELNSNEQGRRLLMILDEINGLTLQKRH